MGVFFLLFGIEMGKAAQVVFELVVFGIGCQTTCALHHEAAEDGQQEDAEGEVCADACQKEPGTRGCRG